MIMFKKCKGKECKYYMWNSADWWIWYCILDLPKLK